MYKRQGEWTLAQVDGSLQMLFDQQYILTERVEVETRYDSDDEPYSWYICYVTLENKNLSHLPVSLLSEEQMSRYSIYMLSLIHIWHPTSLCSAMNGCGTKAGVLAFSTQGGLP